MDALKKIIAKQKEEAAQAKNLAGGRYIKLSEVEAKRRREIEESEATELKKKQKRQEEELKAMRERLLARQFSLEEVKKKSSVTPQAKEDAGEEQTPPLPQSEVFKRLRKLKQPVTLFGETPWARYRRLCCLELQSLDDDLADGQRHAFHQLSKEGEEEDDEEEPQPAAAGGTAQTTSDAPQEEAKASECKEDKPEADKQTPEGRQQTAFVRQTRKDLKPLIRKLKHRQLESDICDRLHEIVELCEERKYREAHNAFMLLAIGNAAWPMGVTMVGIHERAGRTKVFSSQIAHILNDETTRKYIQMIKRLMSFCQRTFKADPSQTILLSVHHV